MACGDGARRYETIYGEDGWTLISLHTRPYALEAHGRATDSAGAAVGVRARDARFNGYGKATATLPLDRRSAHRIRITAELRGQDVRERAVIWLKAEGTEHPLETVYPLVPVHGTSDWVSQRVEAFAPRGAARVDYGVLLQGNGEVRARGLRIDVQPVPPPGTPLAHAAARELDSAIAFARKYSLWRDTVTWEAVERDVRTAAAGATTPEEVYPAIRILLAALGDHHSYLMRPAERQTIERGTGAIVADVRALDDSVGYIAIPGYMESDHERERAYALRIYSDLERVAPAARCGWIVDLRRNTGGIGTPMLAGLQPFIGRGMIGGTALPTRDSSGRVRWVHQWVVSDWLASDSLDARPPSALAPLDTAYVAVITGSLTGSAGEVVTIAFRGRPHTRSFGRPTAGRTTGALMLTLPDSARLAVGAFLYTERTGRSYSGSIPPDELLPDGRAATGGEDAAIAAAVRWLTARTNCGHPLL